MAISKVLMTQRQNVHSSYCCQPLQVSFMRVCARLKNDAVTFICLQFTVTDRLVLYQINIEFQNQIFLICCMKISWNQQMSHGKKYVVNFFQKTANRFVLTHIEFLQLCLMCCKPHVTFTILVAAITCGAKIQIFLQREYNKFLRHESTKSTKYSANSNGLEKTRST